MRVLLLAFALLGVGCDCEPGSYTADVYIANGPANQTVSGQATIRRMDYVTVFSFSGGDIWVKLAGVPSDLFPDGASVYAVIATHDTPLPGTSGTRPSTEITTYDGASPSPETLHAAAWNSDTLPALQGATLVTDGTECERDESDCVKHYSRVKVTLTSGESLSVGPGEEGSAGKIRMGNGGSYTPHECAETKPYFMGYLAVGQ